MSGVLTVVVVCLMVVTLLVMIAGVVAMARGGEFNQKHGNRLMQLRVKLQLATLVAFALLLLARA